MRVVTEGEVGETYNIGGHNQKQNIEVVRAVCSLLDELTKITSTKFIIVTHHALTMSKMNRLYGVTMPEKGISQLVAVDLQKAESMVA